MANGLIVRRALVLGSLLLGSSMAMTSTGAGALGPPKAGISINPAPGPLTVRFVAQEAGFPAPVSSYTWSFGDGSSATTTTAKVTHTYPSASVFPVSVTESDSHHDSAVAAGTLKLYSCPLGTPTCSTSLSGANAVQDVTASGTVNPSAPAALNIFIDPLRFANCPAQSHIASAVGLTDSGFAGPLTVSVQYISSNPSLAPTTCFSSTVAFIDAAGARVNSGPLPTCTVGKTSPPCVQSIQIAGSKVTKVLLIPPGDPKVGAG